MAVGTAGAIILSGLLTTGVGLYQSEEQKKAADEAAKKAEDARRAAEAERLRIARDTRPDAVAATGIKYGADNGDSEDTNGFLVKRTTTPKNSGLTSYDLSGLGYVK